jgi:hypothetical protein
MVYYVIKFEWKMWEIFTFFYHTPQTFSLKWKKFETYKVVDHGFVEGSNVEVEHAVDDGPLLWILGIEPVVRAVLAHQVTHYGPTESKMEIKKTNDSLQTAKRAKS